MMLHRPTEAEAWTMTTFALEHVRRGIVNRTPAEALVCCLILKRYLETLVEHGAAAPVVDLQELRLARCARRIERQTQERA